MIPTIRLSRSLLPALLLAASPLHAQDSASRGASPSLPLAVLQPVALRASPLELGRLEVGAQDTVPRRRRASVQSEWYGRRLTIHRYGSYVMLPLFIAQYTLGNRLIGQKEDLFAGRRLTPIDGSLRNSHRAVAGGVAALFLVNTTTGLWNLLAIHGEPEGRKLRTVHALTMLASDAGFVTTGILGARASDSGVSEAHTHRAVALTSFGVATAGASLMWFGR
jgi:hypothetical protein